MRTTPAKRRGLAPPLTHRAALPRHHRPPPVPSCRYFRSKYFHQGHSSEPVNAKSLKSAERREIDRLFQKYEPSPEELAADRRRLAQGADPHMDLTRTAAESLRWRDVSCHG